MSTPVVANAVSGGSGEKITLKAPVMPQKDGHEWRYRFVLPQSYSLDSAPRPLNPEVFLAEAPRKPVASVRYFDLSTTSEQSQHDVCGFLFSG